LTLAVDEDFKVLFIVLVFHRMFRSCPLFLRPLTPTTETFEGLGIGSRLAYLELPNKYRWYPVAGAVLFGLTTPLGIAVGLGVRTTYNPGSATASIVSGVLDSLSAGILIYTGLVEVCLFLMFRSDCLPDFPQLFAHEFLFSKEMMQASNSKLTYAVGSMCLGAGLMALLGRWA